MTHDVTCCHCGGFLIDGPDHARCICTPVHGAEDEMADKHDMGQILVDDVGSGVSYRYAHAFGGLQARVSALFFAAGLDDKFETIGELDEAFHALEDMLRESAINRAMAERGLTKQLAGAFDD